ncbi:MAG TPA: gamma-glutamyl-gamma-aminobutyrate hydrolase family protein, partial [Dissulfurispiraceae bacterium]|nr:gamma-glutamyl-gamma-aminobutyrate hydrolase family protein [Dissulfurispiraceae bacterium]
MKPVIGITADLNEQGLTLKRAYLAAVAGSGGLPLVVSPFVSGSEDKSAAEHVPDIVEVIDGLVLSGGGDLLPDYYGEAISVPAGLLKPVERTRSDFEIELVRETLRRGKPVLGICYGMQLLNVALGGSLYQDIGVQVKGARDHREGQHGIMISDVFTPALSPLPSVQFVNSTHHQAVRRSGEGMRAFAVSEEGIIEGVYLKDHPFVAGVQWHPERLSSHALSLALFRSFVAAAQTFSAKDSLRAVSGDSDAR